MDFLTQYLSDFWLALVTGLVAICAAVAMVLPPPREGGSALYGLFYKAVQWIALNHGKAKNAQDEPVLSENAKSGT